MSATTSEGVWATGALGVAAMSAACVWVLMRRFRAAGVIDHVGERSSHSHPTPRGGGLGFVTAATVAWVAASILLPDVPIRPVVGVACAGVLVAAVGLLDDVRGVPAVVRLFVHLCAAAMGAWVLSAFVLFDQAPVPQIVGASLLVVAIAWCVNAFNFMDGTDAFAASNGLAVAGAVLTLLWSEGMMQGAAFVLALAIAAAVAGFLPFNLPKARIFMGDVGSGWLGLVVALCLLAAYRERSQIAFAGMALLSPFLMDPSVCLARRALRGERVWQAHRSHGYQNVARRLGSHARLLAVWWSLMLVVYLPIAVLVARHGAWPWLPMALVGGIVQALLLKSGVPGIAER